MPRCFSSSIQSEVAWRVALRARTSPATWMAPPKYSSFSVRVVLPASGWEMMAKVRRRAISVSRADTAAAGGTEKGRDYTASQQPSRRLEVLQHQLHAAK